MLSTENETNQDFFIKDNLCVKIFNTREEMGMNAAEDVALQINHLLNTKEEINMVFAAAPSQQEFMEALISSEEIAWSRINAFHMDEYIGLKKEDPQRFGNFLKERLFSRLQFKSIHYINGEADVSAECLRYATLLKEYPPDIVCLGIGENGHIAFNDPHVADFNDPQMVKVVDLDDACRQQQVNDKCFDAFNDVPAKALTLTIPALIAADYMFCVVPAKNKAQAVFRTLNEPVNESCPATILRTKKNAILYLDKDSASLL